MGRTAKQLQDIDRHAIAQNVKQTHGSQSRYRFALSLSTLLAERGIEQKEFARLIPAADSTVSDYCMGKKDPKLTTIARMAELLGVDCHRLMTGATAEYKSICEETGLSQKAVENLHAIAKEPPCEHRASPFSKTDIINHLAEVESLSSLLGDISDGLGFCLNGCVEESRAIASGTPHTRKPMTMRGDLFGFESQSLIVPKSDYGEFLLSRVGQYVVRRLQNMYKEELYKTEEWKARMAKAEQKREGKSNG